MDIALYLLSIAAMVILLYAGVRTLAVHYGKASVRIAAAVVLLGCGLALEFLPEAMALGWHLRHGNWARIGEYEVPVSAWSWAYLDQTPSGSLIVYDTPGRFRRSFLGKQDWGMTQFSESPIFTAKLDPTLQSKLDQRMGTSSAISQIRMAGEPATCFRRNDPKFPTIVLVECKLDAAQPGLAANFMGPRDRVPQFFATLQQVSRSPK